MISKTLEDLSREDLLKIMQRDRFVKEQLAQRLGAVMAENVELLGLVQELQAELSEATKSSPAEEPTDN